MIVSNSASSDARVLKMAESAIKYKHEVHVFGTIADNTMPFEERNGIYFHRLEWKPVNFLLNLPIINFFFKYLRRPAIFLAKGLSPYIKYYLFSHIFTKHIVGINPDIIHAHDLICLPTAVKSASLCNASVIYDAHELETHRNPPLPILQKMFVRYIEKKYGSQAHAVITVGDLIRKEIAKIIKNKKIYVIYNSPIIEITKNSIRKDLKIDSKTPLIIYIGKLTEGRGIYDILNILPKLPHVIFATVGPYQETIKNTLYLYAKKLGVETRFRILPPVPNKHVVNYVKGADLGIIAVEPITLSYQYCMPNKLFEMAFANMPIVSNELDEIASFIREHKNGEIIDYEDTNSLPLIFSKVLSQKPNYLMSKRIFTNLQRKYSWAAQEKILIDIYASALKRI